MLIFGETARFRSQCLPKVSVAALLVLFYVVPAVMFCPALSMLPDYTPIRSADLKKRFELKPVRDADKLKEGQTISALGCSFKLTEEGYEIEIRGKDALKKPWRILKHYFGLGTAIFSADLDRNGKQDLVFFQATGACGIAPPAVLTLVLFDKNNFPNIYEFSGYASMDRDDWEGKRKIAHIDDILDLEGDGEADIVTEQLDSADVRGKTRSYWRTILYSANASRMQKRSSYQNHSAPMIVAYKYKPNHRVEVSPARELLPFDDGSYVPRRTCGIVKAVGLNVNKHVETIELEGGKTLSSTFEQINRNKELFEPFLVLKKSDETAVLAWDTAEATEALQKAAESKRRITYAPRSLRGHLPILTEMDLSSLR